MIVFCLRKSFLFVEKVIFFLFVEKIFPQTNTINSMDRAQKNKQGLCWSS